MCSRTFYYPTYSTHTTGRLCLFPISLEGMCRVFLKQTVEKRGILVFRVSKSSETSPHSGREGETLTALQAEGATQAPVICSESERERM